MYSIKTAHEAYEAAIYYEKQNKANQLIKIATDIEEAIKEGRCKIAYYPPNYLYQETILTLQSLGYVIEETEAGYISISWEKG